MKEKILTAISATMVFVPWTILWFRRYEWALEMPTAVRMIICYAIFMIFSGVFTMLSYIQGKAQNLCMKLCLMINGVYGVFGMLVLGMIIQQRA